MNDDGLRNGNELAPADGENHEAPSLRPLPRALVCEDDPSVRIMLNIILGRESFEVVAVSNGVEAIARLDEPFDVIILDLMMPTKNGFDVLEHLQRNNPMLLDRVVVLTAHAEIKRQPLRVPVASAVVKPFELRDFVEIVRRVADSNSKA
jgi:two-component system, OmpR family, alkaline phosphatase synthesis response regulator PhoP